MKIERKNIERYYKNKFVKTYVLRNINLEVEEGEFISIMGPSGSGKSTLLHILGMLDTPSGGEYIFYNGPVHKMSERQLSEIHKSHIGFVFQSYHLIDELTVYENLETPLLYQKVKSTERKGRVADILDRFNMVAKKDLFPNQLSGGQQQRVAVSHAIVSKPKMILADEPTGNLDSSHSDEVMRMLSDINDEGTTVVMVTHSPTYAEYGNRIIHLFDGLVVTENFKQEFHV